jgi:ornithine cyclodeaminase/alanine dehydrogenase-like protein (mu-crystallin family)
MALQISPAGTCLSDRRIPVAIVTENSIPFIQASDVEHLLTWQGVVDALLSGHRLDRADIDDIMFRHDQGTLLNRAAWVQGLGIGVKTATIFPGNKNLSPALPNVHAVFTLLDCDTGVPLSLIDGDMVTKWKTAADSILGAKFLARPDSQSLLVVGAGVVAESIIDAYQAVFKGLTQVFIWNRSADKAQALALRKNSDNLSVTAVTDLASIVPEMDIISCATMSTAPVLKGQWVTAGTHVDLIGAYRPDMREADDILIQKAELFVDSRETTIHDIGELLIPLQTGIIAELDVLGDFYDLCGGAKSRTSDDAITMFKNGGGAHLDLMTANYIYKIYKTQTEL